MRLILKYWQLRKKIYFTENSWETFFVDILLIFLFSYLGYVFAISTNKYTSGNLPFNVNILKLISIALLTTPVLAKFIKGGFKKNFAYSKHFPGRIKQIAFTDLLVYGFLSVKNLNILFFILLFVINDPHLYVLIYLILFAISGILIVENILNAITFHNTGYFMVLIFSFMLIITMVSRFHFHDLQLIILASLCVVFYGFSYLHYYEFSNNDSKNVVSFNSKNIYLLMALRKKTFRKSLITSFVFKCIWLFYMILRFQIIGKGMHIPALIYYLACMPFVIFTYMFNNIWGYYKSLALNLIVSGASLRKYLYLYSRLLVFPILCDLILSSFLLAIIDHFNLQFLLCYSALCLYAVPVGFLGSLLKYKPITKEMSFKSIKPNASVLINMITLIGFVLIVLFKMNLWIKLSMMALFITPLIVLYILIITDNNILYSFKYKIMQTRTQAHTNK